VSAKEWFDSAISAWPILAGIIMSAVGFVLGNDRQKRAIALLAEKVAQLSSDLGGLGPRVNRVASEADLARQRCDRAKEDHEKLEAEYRLSQKELPEREKNLRHEVINVFDAALQKVDDRVDELRDDVRDLKRAS
jgi:chromosome segregation ATPase